MALHFVERDVGAPAHDLEEFVGCRLVRHVERYRLERRFHVAERRAEDVQPTHRQPEALPDAIEELPVFDEVGVGRWFEESRRVHRVRLGEAVRDVVVLDSFRDLRHAGRFKRHLGRGDVVGGTRRRRVPHVGGHQQIEVRQRFLCASLVGPRHHRTATNVEQRADLAVAGRQDLLGKSTRRKPGDGLPEAAHPQLLCRAPTRESAETPAPWHRSVATGRSVARPGRLLAPRSLSPS